MRTVTLRVTIAASWVLAACLSSRASAQSPQPAPQPQPQQQPQPYPPPQPQAQPQPYPPPPPPQPYPPYPQPYPAPYPAQQQYPQQPYPYPPPPAPDGGLFGRRVHDGTVIGNFAVVGALAGIDILLRQDVEDGSLGTLIMVGGVAGGGAAGYLLTQKYEVDAGTANATTIGMVAGTANGALLIKPMLDPEYAPEDIMGLLFVGSAIGAGAGFVYGKNAELTAGQSTFLGNVVLLGTSTAALAAILGSRNGTYDNWENGTLAIGLDAGLLGGALIAPNLDWSKKRARIVLAGTVLGALAGGMGAGLVKKRDETSGDTVAGFMTAGLWAGFGLGILLTRDHDPDASGQGRAPATPAPAPSTSFMPFVGEHGMGMAAGGTW